MSMEVAGWRFKFRVDHRGATCIEVAPVLPLWRRKGAVQQQTVCGVCGVLPERVGHIHPRMKRLVFEIAMGTALIIASLEAVHYRNAVLAANIDLNRAWKTVVELREKCGRAPPDSRHVK